jgi:hypothetical protein
MLPILKTHPPIMKLKSLQVLSLLTLAVAATAQPEKAAAIDLNFSTTTQSQTDTNPFSFGFGPGVGNSGPVASSNPTGSTGSVVVNYTNVFAGVDARVTAQTFGTGYSFVEHIPNYSVNTAGQPVGDAAFLYQIAANTTGKGGLTYKIDLFQTDGTTHSYNTAYTATDLRLFAYDVDGEAAQGEALRVFKGTDTSGLIGYQLGSTSPLAASEDATSYLFTGPGVNRAETDPSGAALLYFQNTSSVTFQFEANTTTASANNNPVFSAIDGDVSLIGNNATNFDASGHATPAAGFGTYVQAQKIPEPFTIIGSLIGGGVAFGMRKKLKATSNA